MHRMVVSTTHQQPAPACPEDLVMIHHKALAFEDGVALLAAQLEVGDIHETNGIPGVIVRLTHREGGRFVLLSADGARTMIASLQACIVRVELAAQAQLDERLAAIGKGAR